MPSLSGIRAESNKQSRPKPGSSGQSKNPRCLDAAYRLSRQPLVELSLGQATRCTHS